MVATPHRRKSKMDNTQFLELCKEQVVTYFNNQSDTVSISINEVYVVWLSKTLQNNKALLSTAVSDGMYYELTYNGDKKELYFDAYKKCENKAIKLEEEK